MPQQAAAAALAHGALLAGVFPELGSPAQSSPEITSAPDGHTLQNAVREWFTSMSQQAPLLLAVDDFHRIDEPSAALLTLLATQGKGALCLIASVVLGSNSAANPAQKLLLERASRVSLEPLSLRDTESLLKSLFGDVANLAGLARRLQEITAGNPRDLLRLAEHLVDSGVARYEAGAWTLPARIEQVELPGSMEQALRAKLGSLPGGALTLAAGLALCADRVFSPEECGVLQVDSEASLRRNLDALLQAGVVGGAPAGFGVGPPGWGDLIVSVSRSRFGQNCLPKAEHPRCRCCCTGVWP
jgi:predicted ATPase